MTNGESAIYRRAAVAGRFYPGSPDELEAAVDDYVHAAAVDPAPDRVVAIVAPHAGYPYSGPTAGYAYARISGMRPRRVILLGNSHRYRLETASVVTGGAFENVLGDLQVDAEFATKVAQAFDSSGAEPHMLEHALEVHLPFIRHVLGDVPIVPILFGGNATDWHAEAGERLAAMCGDSDLLIVSTDLSHYHPQAEANQLDQRSLDYLLSGDVVRYADAVANKSCLMCGSSAVAAAMAYAKARGGDVVRLLDYRTSADVSGDFDSVVGYAAVSMERAA